MQNKILRLMTFTFYHAHTAPIFRDLEILTIDKLIVHRIGIVMYKFNYRFLPEVLKAMYRKIVKFILIILEIRTCFELHQGLKHFLTSVLEFGILLW